MALRCIKSGPYIGQPAITKAEILFTRRCNLRCAGCAMMRVDEEGLNDTAQSDREEMGMDKWFAIIDNLHELGCGLCAVYGAEIALVPNRVASFIHYAEIVKNISTTVITSAAQPYIQSIVDLWWRSGLRSLTVSVDGLEPEQMSSVSSRHKTHKGMELLTYFVNKYHPEFRDAEACMTLTRRNFKVLPEIIRRLSDSGIWFHFDLLHVNRDFPGNKVMDSEDVGDLQFTTNDYGPLMEILSQVQAMKAKGYLIHSSVKALGLLQTREGFECQWQCCQGVSGFLGFVTIDVNGVVRPCDDFLPPVMDTPYDQGNASPERRGGRLVRKGNLVVLQKGNPVIVRSDPIYGWELVKRWDEYRKRVKQEVENYGCHCSWTTHFDAQEIYEGGEIGMDHYTHRQILDV